MNVNDLLNVGSGILNDVTRAVETGNYDGLGERTKERVAFAATQFSSVGSSRPVHEAYKYSPGNTAKPVGSGQNQTRAAAYQPYQYGQNNLYNQNRSYFLRSADSIKHSGLPQIIGGGIGTVIGAFGALASFGVTGIMAIAGMSASAVSNALSGVFFSALLIMSLGLLRNGIKTKNLVKRYYEYGSVVGNAEYFSLEKLAERVGTTVKELTKNIEQMIRKNLLPGAKLDRKKTTLMLTDRAYEQYRQAEASRVEREARAQLAGEPAVTVSSDMDGDVKRIIEDGNRAIVHVRAINDEIPDTLVMSDKLYRLEEIMRRIFDQVKKDPSSAQDLRKFMDYYLPTTTKLLSAYVELDRQPVQGENIKKTKMEIEESLDTINDAFEQLLDGMFSDMAMDISTDISVMKTMMAQDGLSGENAFESAGSMRF